MPVIHTGSRLGRYEVHEYLGQGSLGPVFRGYDPTSGSVAVKVLESLSEEGWARFRALAPALAALRHPNLVSVLNFGELGGEAYLVLEYVQGGSLASRMRGGTLGQKGALWVLRGAAAGIDHAHRSGFVHGDLHPGQVLLGPDDHPFVGDVGMGWLRRVSPTAPDAPAIAPAYLAPEQVHGGEPTTASDCYAFAAIVYWLLVGRTPFEGHPEEVLRARLRSDPPPPSAVRPELGRRTDQVVLRGLAREPGARWQTCTQLIEALEEALRQDAAPAFVMGAFPRRRRPWPWALVGATLAALVAGGLVYFFYLSGGRSPTVGLQLSASVVPAGGSLTVSADHLPAGQVGTIDLSSDPVQVGVFQADPSGNVRQRVTVPADTTPGGHLLSLCWQGRCPVGAPLTVTAAPPSPAPSPSPSPTPAITPPPSPTPIVSATPSPSPLTPAPPTPGPTASVRTTP
ncbi:MAG TPA: serine/threonine-protein kinase [Candidatus Dormibacteraeota bacterium]|nr:serine/threonine-protein kinase [Candidatus Dormibacteraeota bacterium]